MRSLDDQALDAPAFQQQGVELLLKTLRESPVPVTIASFGSLRPIAVAYNRDPALFHSKVAAVHISAGTAYGSLDGVPNVVHAEVGGGPGFNREWNVALDPLAFVAVLRTDLPTTIYPCAAPGGADVLHPRDSFWRLPNSHFIEEIDPKLRRYLEYQYGEIPRKDFLRAMDGLEPAEVARADAVFDGGHNVWETAVWMAVSSRVLVKHADGSYEIIPEKSRQSTDVTMKNDLVPCRMELRDDANFVCDATSGASNFRFYERGDPITNQAALQEALPKLYRSFKTSR